MPLNCLYFNHVVVLVVVVVVVKQYFTINFGIRMNVLEKANVFLECKPHADSSMLLSINNNIIMHFLVTRRRLKG